jgi:hypothetical protein
MTVQDHIAAYADGWTRGDVDKICGAAADDMLLDDPNAGRIGKPGLADYARGLIAAVDEMRGGAKRDVLMSMSDVVIDDSQSPVTAWAWFEVPGTPIAGAAIMKFTDAGMVEERIAYKAKLG